MKLSNRENADMQQAAFNGEGLRNVAHDPHYMAMNAALMRNQFSAEEIAEWNKERAIRAIQSQPYFKDKP